MLWKTLTLTALAALLYLAPAEAVNCGTGQTHTTCECGDTVVGSYTMPAALTCSTGHGLNLSSFATLNCNQYQITGNYVTDTYGIHFDEVSSAVARNCHVRAFFKGVRFDGGFSNTFKDGSTCINGNPSTHAQGGYGVDVGGSASGSTVKDVLVCGNHDEGLHVGGGAVATEVINTEICGNYDENLYIIGATATRVQNTTAGHDCYGYTTNGNSFYMKDALHTHILGSTFNNNPVHVTGSTVGTHFVDVTLNTTYDEDCYQTVFCPTLTRFLIDDPNNP